MQDAARKYEAGTHHHDVLWASELTIAWQTLDIIHHINIDNTLHRPTWSGANVPV